MKKKIWAVLGVLAVCLLAAMPALAADVFAFSEKSITLFEDETGAPPLTREGAWADGEVVYSSESAKVATVSEDGIITPAGRGKTRIVASLRQNGKQIRRATIEVQVLRRVTKVTLSAKGLTMMAPDDPALSGLLTDSASLAEPVIVLIAGRSVPLNAVCTPEDASNRRISYATNDVGVAKIENNNRLRGVEKGECDLTVTSVQNPEIEQVFHVLVIQPVKKIQIEAPDKNIFVGEGMELSAICTPDDASIRSVVWNSRRPSIASVDADGVVTGLAKGDVTIEALAADGSGVAAVVTIHVQQNVTGITLKQTDMKLTAKRSAQINATVLPKEANNKKLIWTSSDETIAVAGKGGQVSAKKAGTCVITCTSESNPAVSASVTVQVVQPVTKITFTPASGVTLPVRTSEQLIWTVEPADASIKDVTFKSNHPDILAVGADGSITGVKRGVATVTATATDGSKRTGSVRVTVTQPVEGVTLARQLYYIQRGRGSNIRATVLPKDANNQKVYWSIGDESLATVRTNGTSTGRVTGRWNGITTLTATTEDGGYTASASVMVADFDGAVMVEGLEITRDNKIRITLRNAGSFAVERVYFRVDCYDLMGKPMMVNKDGVSTGFDGTYPLPLQSGERSMHGQFWFTDYLETGKLGEVVLTITGYLFDNGQKWEIPKDYRVPTLPARSALYGTVTPTPLPAE